jgi:hypothetical protein
MDLNSAFNDAIAHQDVTNMSDEQLDHWREVLPKMVETLWMFRRSVTDERNRRACRPSEVAREFSDYPPTE